jgi:hypothetical protein
LAGVCKAVPTGGEVCAVGVAMRDCVRRPCQLRRQPEGRD